MLTAQYFLSQLKNTIKVDPVTARRRIAAGNRLALILRKIGKGNFYVRDYVALTGEDKRSVLKWLTELSEEGLLVKEQPRSFEGTVMKTHFRLTNRGLRMAVDVLEDERETIH